MTYVITEPCIGVKDAGCVDVCPVDCIHATDADPMFFIDPDGLEGEVLLDKPGTGPADMKPPGTPAAGYERVLPER